MSNLWEDCENIRKEEFKNLQKSKGRPRTLGGILEKTEKLKELGIKFEENAQKLEYRSTIENWNELTDNLFVVQFEIKESLKILDETPISHGNIINRNTLEALKTGRRASESDNTLKVPTLDYGKKSSSAGNLTMAIAKMEEFSMVTAIQCIPEFHGKSEELDPFVMQIEYFYDMIPEGGNQVPLLNVVYMKLKGKALLRLPYLKGRTWPEVKNKLEDELGNHNGN